MAAQPRETQSAGQRKRVRGPSGRPDYTRLLEFRTELRRFDRFSRDRAQELGLTQTQHQLLLAIRGHRDERGPTIGEVADYLLVQHHTVVGLADRTADLGLIARNRDPDDHRIVRLVLTDEGHTRINALTAVHLEELRRLAPLLDAILSP